MDIFYTHTIITLFHFFEFFFTGDGELDKIELQNALKKNLNITSKDIHQKDIRGLFELIDSDGSHSIDKMEFVSIFGLAAESQIAQDAKKSGTLKMYISSFEKSVYHCVHLY